MSFVVQCVPEVMRLIDDKKIVILPIELRKINSIGISRCSS